MAVGGRSAIAALPALNRTFAGTCLAFAKSLKIKSKFDMRGVRV
jgi:hypothetical protein